MRADFTPPDFVPDGYTPLQRLGSGQTSTSIWPPMPAGRGGLKLPRTELQHRPVLRRMFENEVQITLGLKHPNVVQGFAGYPTGHGRIWSSSTALAGPSTSFSWSREGCLSSAL